MLIIKNHVQRYAKLIFFAPLVSYHGACPPYIVLIQIWHVPSYLALKTMFIDTYEAKSHLDRYRVMHVHYSVTTPMKNNIIFTHLDTTIIQIWQNLHTQHHKLGSTTPLKQYIKFCTNNDRFDPRDSTLVMFQRSKRWPYKIKMFVHTYKP